MEWDIYKTQVDGSRRLIVYPFFEKHLSNKEGVGVDVGCGNGDLTAHIDQLSAGSVVGIDKYKKSLEQARARHSGLHFVCGEIDKNTLPTVGITFDFAFSNCCFCHISDEGIYNVLFDLHSCMKDGAELVFLVPSIAWAKSMYGNVQFERSGITAVPRYGGRQFFRTSEWYLSALRKCGFEILSSEEITIPDDDSLEDRYRDNVGKKLFSAFVARRVENLPNSKSMKEAFEIAHDNRKLEIQLFWQRSLFFWGFVAAALVGYGSVYNEKSEIEIVFALFGLVCSVVWSSGNRGSKYWQEYWEQKVTFFQHYATGNIFYDRTPKTPGFLEVFSPRRMSVSKLTMALSDYSIFLWILLCVHSISRSFRDAPTDVYQLVGALTLLTLCYCLWFLNKSKSED